MLPFHRKEDEVLLSNQTNQLLMKINNVNLDTYNFHALKEELLGNNI